MPTIELVKEAILAFKDRTGSSVPAITKWILSEKKLEVKKHVMKAALKRGVDTGVLVQIRASYKLSADGKKSSKPKAAKQVLKKTQSGSKKTATSKTKGKATKKTTKKSLVKAKKTKTKVSSPKTVKGKKMTGTKKSTKAIKSQ